jgi:hypothetical protein
MFRRPEKTLNLIFVHQPKKLSHTDFNAIAAKIVQIAPEVQVFGVLPTETVDVIPRAHWARPTLTVSFGRVGRFVPLRGPIYENRFVPKLQQFRSFLANGFATPHMDLFRSGMDLDPHQWGPFVILKPLDPARTSNGKYLQVFRTAALSGRRLPDDHASHQMPMLVQSWIDTGTQMSSYRCLTLFGAVLYSMKLLRTEPRPSLEAPDHIIEAMPAESDRGNRIRNHDRDILEFATAMAAVFPRHPILGCDIIREEKTAKLYALEVNAGGNVWHFSSPSTERWRTYEKTHSLKVEFSSFETAAEMLARKTRLEAR